MTVEQISDERLCRAARFAMCHYVPFSFYDLSPARLEANGGRIQTTICSAFFVDIKGFACLVTAGHVVRDIAAARSSGARLERFRLFDGWGVGAAHRGYIPFDYFGAPKFHIYELGMDYGVIVLRPGFALPLLKNATPIRQESIDKDWPSEFHGYAMIGTPSTTVTTEPVGKQTVIGQSVVSIILGKIDDPPDPLSEHPDRFFGEILADPDSSQWKDIEGDIDGMSGGLVVGVRDDGLNNLRYWPLAVQSGWLASRRIISACYFQAFARIVGKCFDHPDFDGRNRADYFSRRAFFG